MENANKPAMPVKTVSTYGTTTSKGLTKREMFAMHAMQAAISNNTVFEYGNFRDDRMKIELKKFSYEMADIMLSEELS